MKSELIQNLWGGYGTLSRVFKDSTSFIDKRIKFPPNPHPRKVKSYNVEANWYKHYNHELQTAYSPRYIDSGDNNGEQFLILEDLQIKGFLPIETPSWDQVKLCLKWLATFHAHYLNSKTDGLWDIGTYWHLDTRPDELEAMNDHELKDAASIVDEKLNGAKYKTIVHGDAKLANFLFNTDTCAAVDFQYIGGGVGIKDVAYFLSSIYHEDELFEKDQDCLEYYFNNLDVKQEVKDEWKALYSYAWCDFYRFLQGWSPGHWKMHRYSESMKKKVLNEIK